MSKYKIVPASGEKPHEIEADRYTFDEVSGRHQLYSGDELVASLINVSIYKLADQPADQSTPPTS